MQKKYVKLPSVTVVLINYKNYLDTEECLKTLLRTKYGHFSIIVLDNSGDLSKFNDAKNKFNSNKIKWLYSKKNLGFAGGNNYVLKNINTKYVVMLNNDTVVKSSWLSRLVSYAENNPQISILQPKIKSYYKPQYFEYAGAAGGFMDFFGYPYAMGRVGFSLEEDRGQYNKNVDIFWASGAAFFAKTELFKQIGYLSESFFFYHEETDLCWRAINSGYKIQSCPQSVIYHKGASASKANMSRRIFFIHRNNLLMVARNYNIILLPLILLLRIFLDSGSAFFYIFQGNYRFLLSLIYAWISFIAKLPKIYAFRKHENNWFNKSYILLTPLSVYFSYFLLGKKRYDDLSHGIKGSTKIIPYKIY